MILSPRITLVFRRLTLRVTEAIPAIPIRRSASVFPWGSSEPLITRHVMISPV